MFLKSWVTGSCQVNHFFFCPQRLKTIIYVFWPIPLWIITNLFLLFILYFWIVEDGYPPSLITLQSWKYLYIFKIYILYLWQDAQAILSKQQLPEPTNLCICFTSTKQGQYILQRALTRWSSGTIHLDNKMATKFLLYWGFCWWWFFKFS